MFAKSDNDGGGDKNRSECCYEMRIKIWELVVCVPQNIQMFYMRDVRPGITHSRVDLRVYPE